MVGPWLVGGSSGVGGWVGAMILHGVVFVFVFCFKLKGKYILQAQKITSS